MAYGVRWFSEFDDIQENVKYRTEILDRDFTGTAKQVLSGENPFILETTGSDDVYDPIRAQKATIEWIADDVSNFNINDLFITDDKKYQVAFWKYVGNTLSIIWRGYLVPIDCEEPFQSRPYPVTMSATCGLPFIRDTEFLDIGGAYVTGKLSLIKIISSALANTGLNLDIHTYIDLYEQDMNSNASPLAQAEIDSDGLRGEEGYNVLSGILAAFGAFVVQVNGKWVIQGVREQNSFNGNLKAFNSNGDPISSATVQRAASFGRTKYGTNVPAVRPQANVIQRLAEPNSIVTETVSPGIAVNRLSNGTFSGAVIGGVIPGWRNQIKGGVSWAREGFGTPDDPYRLVFRSPVYIDPRKKQNTRYPITPDAFFDTGPIEINVGDFNLSADERPDLKLVFSGLMKSNNVFGALFFVTINESERKGVSFLVDSGEWKYNNNNISDDLLITPVGKPYTNQDIPLDQLEYKSFEIESQEITNYLKVNGNGVAQIRVRIYPGPRLLGQNQPNALLSIEDLALTFYTGTAYEGEHKYQADGNLPIRNANEVEYTVIIADKIGITTPEQERDVNRVMTGYMTITGTNNLTSAWIRSGDNIFEPIQKKSLRERIRLLCGKRRIIEGTFIGYDLRPDQPAFNRYDNLGAPSQFFTQTSFKWDVKNAYFDSTFHELDFTPLANEDIYLYDDSGTRRSKRMKGGSSGSTTNTSGSIKTNEQIVVGTLPPIYYTVGQGDIIKVIDLAPYIESSHKPEDLDASVKHFTDWVSNVFIKRGDSGQLLEIHITADPPYEGTDRVLIELTDENGNKNLVAILLIAVAETKFKYELFDTSGTSPVSLGLITEGSGFEMPDSWIIQASVKGYHQAWFASINGPGLNSTVTPYPYLKSADHEDDITYRLPTTGNYISQVGTYALNFATYRYEGDENNYSQIKGETVNFVLYDETYLNKVKFELWSGGIKLGDINPDGSSAFNTEGKAFDVYAILAGLPHTSATLVLKSGATTLKTSNFTQSPSKTDITYKLYNAVANPAQSKGLYELTINTNNTSPAVTYSRMIAFTINEKEVTPKAGVLKLIAAVPNTSNYTVLGTLAASGGSYTLPDNGWNILNDSTSQLFDYEEYKLFQLKSGKLVEVDIELYTGEKQFVDYAEPVTQSNYRIFINGNSTEIDSIHSTPSTFRIIGVRRIGGVSGDLVEKYSSDFSFGPAVDIEDTPISDNTGGGNVDINGTLNRIPVFTNDGLADSIMRQSVTQAISEIINDGQFVSSTPASTTGTRGVSIKNESLVNRWAIGKIGAETGSNAGSDLAFHRFNDAGQFLGAVLTFNRATGKGKFTSQVQIQGSEAPLLIDSDLLVNNLNSDYLDDQHGTYYLNRANHTGFQAISTVTGLQAALDSKVNANGNTNRVAYWQNTTDLAPADQLFYTGGMLGVGVVSPTDRIHTSGNIKANGSFISLIGTGVIPIQVSSTTLNPNLNSDYLDNQHGTYYLDWNNFTNYVDVVAGNGLIGGGTLDQDRTVALGLPGTLNATTTNNVSATSHTHAITTGSIIQGNNVILSGNLANRLIGAGDVTINAVASSGGGSGIDGVGNAGRVTYWLDADTVAPADQLFYSGGMLGVGVPTPDERIHTSGNVKANGSFISAIGTGIVPIQVLSTTLNPNLNADYLDNQHGSYYLNFDNFTNRPNTLGGYGIIDSYTQGQINTFFAGYVPKSTVLTIHGVSYDLSQSRDFGYPPGGGGGTTISGGTKGRLAKFNTAGDNIEDSRVYDGGSGFVEVFGDFRATGLTTFQGGLRLPKGPFENAPTTPDVGQIYYIEGNPGRVIVWTAGGEWRGIEWTLG